MVVESDNHAHKEGSFLLGTSAVLDYVSTDLATFSDAWMPSDLKGRAQPAVHSANAPRLSAALRDLSETLRSETDPDDPTHFGKPTDFGVDNYFDHGGRASDVWSRFEVPYRYGKFTHAPGFGRIGYKRSTEGVVHYAPVRGKNGLLGFLWASDAEQAASFDYGHGAHGGAQGGESGTPVQIYLNSTSHSSCSVSEAATFYAITPVSST
ncbi:hypothetical protein ACH4LT_15140 [Streptomyces clavifer]|uniref:hypothetical protein n=1 Tax=Streptomyces clavifer TaxID=68188 RepID=UPI0037A5828C